MKGLAFLFALSTAIASISSVASAREIPNLTGPVIDEAGVLSSGEISELSQTIQSFLPRTQMQIWIMNSIGGESIEGLSIRAAEKWKLGSAKEDNGVLILLAIEDRAMRIEVGQGLEGSIPDSISARIIDGVMKPAFQAGNYFQGLSQALGHLYYRATGENPGSVQALPEARSRRSSRRSSLFEIIFFLIIIVLQALFGRRRRSGFFGGGGGWGGGGGFRSGGGGGGWSGGGGGFSGGGSSGRW